MRAVLSKCRCGSSWCRACWKQKHIPEHMETFKKMDWTRTRQVILTIDPGQFENGKDAYEHVTKNKLFHNLVRNIERGKKINLETEAKKTYGRKAVAGDHFEYILDKNRVLRFDRVPGGWCDLSTGEALKSSWVTLYTPVKVTNWKWFLEWHENGFPHWHLFIETDTPGKAGMIGVDRLHHYWPWADWIRETYIKKEYHWKRLTGYFEGHGYFDTKKDHGNLKVKKEHQMTLPGWAQDDFGSHKKIRRSCSKVLERDLSAAGYFTRKQIETRDIDLRTGEIRRLNPKRIIRERNYKALFESCGARSRVKIYGGKSYIEGIFSIPYKELKAKFPGGEFQERKGWAFALTYPELLELFDHTESITAFHVFQENSELKRLIEKWHDFRISQGFWDYSRVYGG